MKARVLLATIVGMLLMASNASAHPQAGGFNYGVSIGWLDADEYQIRDYVGAKSTAGSNAAVSAAKCTDGTAAGYPCDNVDLLSYLPLAAIGGGEIGNDIWGWTDKKTKREYAIMGRTNGTAFVDITDPKRPVFVGNLPTQSAVGGQFWRDIKVYKDHAYIVSEHTAHGMQVFDLTRLRGVRNAPAQFTADTVYNLVSNTHNLFINEDTGYAYLVGSNTCAGGPHVVDIRNPKSPTFAGCFATDGYTHDVYCEVYDGPDKRFRGREICFASNEDTVTIYDSTNKLAPVLLSRTGYPTAAYTHQGWLTPDNKYFVFDDELDELSGTVARQTTYILNVESLTNPGTVVASPNNTTSTDHNLYFDEGLIWESNYQSGLRIFDEKSVKTGDLQEVGFFDVYPQDDNPGFEGTWSNYPWYKKKGVVAVSGIDSGLFVLEYQKGKRGGR